MCCEVGTRQQAILHQCCWAVERDAVDEDGIEYCSKRHCILRCRAWIILWSALLMGRIILGSSHRLVLIRMHLLVFYWTCEQALTC